MLDDALLVARYLRHLDRLWSSREREIDRTRGDGARVPRRWRASTTTSSRDVRRIFRERVRLEPGARVPQAPRRGQARDHHLRRDARLPAADGQVPRGGARAGAGGGAALPAHFGARPGGHLAARVRLPARARALPRARPASATSSSTRTASRTRTRGRATASTRPSSRRAASRSSGATRSRRGRCGAPRSGYPGDSDYREFYRDIGWDLPIDYARRRASTTGCARTSASSTTASRARCGLGDKQPYVREWAHEKARRPRGQLPATSGRSRSARDAAGMDRPPLVVSPYDAELFGHWWFEGPDFLDFLFRKMHFDQDVVQARSRRPSTWRSTPSSRSRSRPCAPGAPRATPRSG